MKNRSDVIIERLRIASDGSHHILDGTPLYEKRFFDVQSYHEPGIAAVRDESGSYHIDLDGREIYPQRFKSTYGYYFGRAAVKEEEDWFHIDTNGKPAYSERYSWVGNFQESVCVIRDRTGGYFHIDMNGSPLYDNKYRYVGDYKYGLAVAYLDDGRATHIDLNGNDDHSKHYEELGVYHKGFAIAKDRWGYYHIDSKGKQSYGKRFDWVEPFYNGQALASERGRLLIIDPQGRELATIREALNDHHEERIQIMDDLVGYWRTQILHSTVELGLLDRLDGRVMGERELAQASGLPITSMELLTRVLYAWGYLKRTEDGFSLTEKGRMLTEASPQSLKYAALMWGAEHYQVMARLTEALQSGTPQFETIYGSPFFDYISQNQKSSEIYRKAMMEYTTDYTGILQRLDLSATRVLMDLGGGNGSLLTKVLTNNSNIERAILFDLPDVVNTVAEELSTDRRFQAVGGDFFSDELPSVDTIVLSRVLHDWDDATAARLLKRAFDALQPKGRLIILEMVVPEDCIFDFGASLNLNLLVAVGGRERTFCEFKELAVGSGFKYVDIVAGDDLISAVICER